MTMCVGACGSCIPREDQRQHEKQVANVDTGGNIGHDRHQHLGERLKQDEQRPDQQEDEAATTIKLSQIQCLPPEADWVVPSYERNDADYGLRDELDGDVGD